MNRIESAIFRTVSWFSLFDYPLTRDEIAQWLMPWVATPPHLPDGGGGPPLRKGRALLDSSRVDTTPLLSKEGMGGGLPPVASAEGLATAIGRGPAAAVGVVAVGEALESSRFLQEVLHQEGAYIGRKGAMEPGTLAQVRDERTHDAIRKFARVKRAVRYLKRVPGVIGIAAGNTLAFSHTRERSDIDLFVITKPGLLWSSRLLCVAPFILARARPGAKARDPFCFSFFASEDALNLERLSIPGGDPYLAVWARSLVPVFDAGGVFERFHKLNAWTNRFIPQATGRVQHPMFGTEVPSPVPMLMPWVATTPSALALRAGRYPLLRKEGGRDGTRHDLHGHALPFLRGGTPPPKAGGEGLPPLASAVESIARRIQERRFPQPIRDLLNKDSRVIANDEYLKFHDQDRRAEYRDRWFEECRIYGV